MLGQWFNVRIPFLKLALNPSLLMPSLIVPNISHIPLANLQQRGFKAICFDKDNTLTAPYSDNIHPPYAAAFEECIARFQCGIVSNSAGSSDDPFQVQKKRIEAALHVPVLVHSKKPRDSHLLSKHFGVDPKAIVVVGDRVLTDIVYGNLAGCYTVLVWDVVDLKGDNPFAVQVRRLEHLGIRLLRWVGLRSASHPRG